MDPWLLIGWLLLFVLIIVNVLIVPIAVWMMRRRKRSIGEFRARRREIQRGLRQPRFSLRDWKD